MRAIQPVAEGFRRLRKGTVQSFQRGSMLDSALVEGLFAVLASASDLQMLFHFTCYFIVIVVVN
jgi:hypothetical protein